MVAVLIIAAAYALFWMRTERRWNHFKKTGEVL